MCPLIQRNMRKEKAIYMVQYQPGDVLIGGMIPIHARGDEDTCGLPTEQGTQGIEIFNIVLDELNSNRGFLPGVKLGSLIIDTCDVDTQAVQRVANIFLPYLTGTVSHTETKKTLFAGVLGATSSAVSMQTTSLLQVFNVPQVSPRSTHPDLSNKDRFPYFFRTVPSDAPQARAIVEFVASRGWNYISVVYEDDAYGIRGHREIVNAGVLQDVCVAVGLVIPRNPNKEDMEEILQGLIDAKSAQAVVIFAKWDDAENLIATANLNPISRGYFLWIATEAWTDSIPSGLLDDDYQESLHGAIGFTVNNEVIPSLKPHMLNLTFGEYLSKNGTLNQRNPWFPEYLASRIGCIFKDVVNVSSGKTNLCKPEDRLNENELFTLSYMQNYADAVLAIATALQKYLKKTCGDITGLCPKVKDALNGIDLANGVFEILKNISFQGINKQNFTFDQNQDGSAVYKIKTFVKRDPSEGAPINNWKTAGLFRSGEITWYEEPRSLEEINSVCSSPCEAGFARKIETQMCCWQCQACLPQQYVGFNGTECLECPRGNSPTLDRKDCRTNEMSHVRYSDPYSIASLIIASVGIVVTFTVSIIYFRNRNTPIVKAAGKEISVIVLVGAMFCFMNSFVLSTEATEIICVISRLLLACGPTLMYAGILTKTVVVVVIFKSKKILYSNIKAYLLPKYQIVAAVILSLIQVMILLAWFFFNPPNASVYYPSPKESLLACNDVDDLIVLIGLAYPFLLILSCTILATINRKVPTGFNETQYIGSYKAFTRTFTLPLRSRSLSYAVINHNSIVTVLFTWAPNNDALTMFPGFTMYATCIIWIAFLPIFIASSSVISLKVSALSICLSLSAITVLVCLFCTRCYVIIFNPEENTSKSVMSSVCQRGTLSTPAINNQTTKMNREASYSDAKLSKTKQKETTSWNEGKKLDGEGDNTQSCAHCGTKL